MALIYEGQFAHDWKFVTQLQVPASNVCGDSISVLRVDAPNSEAENAIGARPEVFDFDHGPSTR